MAVFQTKPSQKPHKNFYAYYRKDLTRIRYKRKKPPAATIYRGNFAPKKFTGKEQDQETGLYYFGARYLDPKTSRWLSTDPALGDYLPVAPNNDDAKKHNQNLPGMGGVFNVINLHVYHYAGNNPVKYVDPDGRDIHIKITGEVVGIGTLRNGTLDSNKTITVPIYKMTVTDDVTGTTSTYSVTRHGVYEDERGYNQYFSFEPKGESKIFRGEFDISGVGAGQVINLFEDSDVAYRGDLYRTDRKLLGRLYSSIFKREYHNETNSKFIQIHVGGKYFNTDQEREVLATSTGCFTLNGTDAGDAGRDRFMNDIRERRANQTEATGRTIYITVDRME